MEFFKKHSGSLLFKLFSLNGFSVFVKVLTGFVTSKFLAITIGTAGLGLLGNFRNFLSSIDTLGTLGLHTGIVKFVASADSDVQRLKKITSTVFVCLCVNSALIAIVLLGFSGFFFQKVLNGQIEFSYLFVLLAIVLPLYLGNLFLNSILTGLGNVKNTLKVGIIGNVITLIVTIGLVYKFQLVGALLSSVLIPAMLFFFNYYFVSRKIELLQNSSFKDFDLELFKNLMHYFLMGCVTGLLGSVVPLIIRNWLIKHTGLEEAGYLEAMVRISTYYFLFLNNFVTIYYFPRLAKANAVSEEKKIIWEYYKSAIPLFCLILLMVFILKDIIIQILFTPDFYPVKKLFMWQIIGDFFKAVSWILGIIFLARQKTVLFIVTEVISFSILLISSLFLIPEYGVEGAVMAHAINYFLYALMLVVYFRKKVFGGG
ncbi:O-antigen translocase [Flavobacterium amniphilum]|uniref:O-antigen translocase n=1 Tax=Flavobacterium amniphilum TaxID=1834035 RepID=UPI00202A4F57|nr:O-antigen translocase [Flavobacterium amniphilum]MCL9805623.1 O-antigen translocase [Flavobacterium amniphilum]